MNGGAGNDTYVVDSGGESVIEVAGGGFDTVESSVSFYFSESYELEKLVLTGSGDTKGYGNSLDNEIWGNSGNNVLRGGLGADTLDGGAGNDVYLYVTAAESSVAAGIDTVNLMSGDLIDLSLIDADTNTGGNQAFSFIGGAAFSNTAGELRAEDKGGYWEVQGDVDGNGTADFVLHVVLGDADPLTAADFFP